MTDHDPAGSSVRPLPDDAGDREFDRAVAEKLRECRPPADLRRTLFAAHDRAVTDRRRWPRRLWSWWHRPSSAGLGLGLLTGAAAAVLLVSLGTGWPRLGPTSSGEDRLASLAELDPSGPLTAPRFRTTMVSFVDHPFTLERTGADPRQLRSWLQGRLRRDESLDVPPGLMQMRGIGCRLLSWHGQVVTLICFRRPDGRDAHLFTVERDAFQQVPASRQAPVVNQEGEWATVGWSDQRRAYLLVSKGTTDELRGMVARTD